MEVEDVENTLPRLVFVVPGEDTCAEFIQPCAPVKVEVGVKVKHDEFTQNGAQLRGMVCRGVVDQAWHVIALLANGIAREKRMK